MSDTGPASTPGRVLGEASPGLRRGLGAATSALRALGPLRLGLADAIGTVAWAADPGRRRITVANHVRLGAPTAAEARRRARASFREYARTTLDFVWANRMPAEVVAARSRLLGAEHVDAAVAGGRGAVLALSHFGNWDFAALIGWSYGLRLTSVMAPVGNPAITRLVVWAREGNALEVFTPEGAARGLVRALRAGRFVALLCDVPEGGPVTTVRFCGGPAEFTVAPAWLAMRTGAPLLPVTCRRGGPGEPDYILETHAPVTAGRGDDATAVMQRVADALEGGVRAHPGQWYPFRPLEGTGEGAGRPPGPGAD